MISLCLGTVSLFKEPVRLKIKEKSFFSSALGEFLSILIYVYLIYNLIISDAFTKKNPQITGQSVQHLNTSTFNFTNENFKFLLALTDLYGRSIDVDSTILSITSSYASMGKNPLTNNFDLFEYEEQIMPNCTDLPQSKLTLDLVAQFPQSKCLAKSNFSIYGSYSETRLQMAGIFVRICNNETMNNTCKTLEQITAFLRNKNIGFAMSKNLFLSDNYENPIQETSIVQFFTLDSSLEKKYKFDIEVMSVVDDDDLVTSNNYRKESWNVLDMNIDIDTTVQNSLANIMFFSSRQEMRYTRTYRKLQDALGSLGGITNIFISIGFVIMKLSPFQHIQTYLSKKLYSFRNINKKNKRKFSNSKKSSKVEKISMKEEKTMEMSNTQTMFGKDSNKLNQNNSDNEMIKSITKYFKKKIITNDVNEFPPHSENYSPRTDTDAILKSLPKPDKKTIFRDEAYEIIPISPLISGRSLNKEGLISKTAQKIVIPRIKQEKNFSDDEGGHVKRKIKPLSGDEAIFEEELKPHSEEKLTTFSQTFEKKRRESVIKKKVFRRGFHLNKKEITEKKSFAETFRKFSALKNQKKELKLNFCDFLHKKTRGEFLTSFKSLRVATSKIDKDLDILTILQRFQELDKLKILLLNKHQLMLFNLIVKPEILIDEEENVEKYPGVVISHNLKSLHETNDQTFLELAEYYNKVKKKQEEDDLDVRLIKLVDKDMKNFFEV